eukprot:gene10525-biopygen6384
MGIVESLLKEWDSPERIWSQRSQSTASCAPWRSRVGEEWKMVEEQWGKSGQRMARRVESHHDEWNESVEWGRREKIGIFRCMEVVSLRRGRGIPDSRDRRRHYGEERGDRVALASRARSLCPMPAQRSRRCCPLPWCGGLRSPPACRGAAPPRGPAAPCGAAARPQNCLGVEPSTRWSGAASQPRHGRRRGGGAALGGTRRVPLLRAALPPPRGVIRRRQTNGGSAATLPAQRALRAFAPQQGCERLPANVR